MPVCGRFVAGFPRRSSVPDGDRELAPRMEHRSITCLIQLSKNSVVFSDLVLQTTEDAF